MHDAADPGVPERQVAPLVGGQCRATRNRVENPELDMDTGDLADGLPDRYQLAGTATGLLSIGQEAGNSFGRLRLSTGGKNAIFVRADLNGSALRVTSPPADSVARYYRVQFDYRQGPAAYAAAGEALVQDPGRLDEWDEHYLMDQSSATGYSQQDEAQSASVGAEAAAVAPFFVKAMLRDTWRCLGTPVPSDLPINAGNWRSTVARTCNSAGSPRQMLWATDTWQRATGYVSVPAQTASGPTAGQLLDAMAFGIESNVGATSAMSLDVDRFDYCVCSAGPVDGVKACTPACPTSCI